MKYLLNDVFMMRVRMMIMVRMMVPPPSDVNVGLYTPLTPSISSISHRKQPLIRQLKAILGTPSCTGILANDVVL